MTTTPVYNQIIEGANRRVLRNAGAPLSGSTNGTFRNQSVPGDILVDTTNMVEYVNEGSLASPYWTPVSFDQRGLLGYWTDFRDEVGKALADTAATVILPSGIRVFGQGIEVNGDSGLTVAQVAEVGPVATLAATNEAEHVAALSVGDATLLYQPDTHGTLVVDVECAQKTDLADRAFFVGFVGLVADALDPAVTGTTVTLTLVQNDLQGLLMDSALTDATGLMAAHNKANEAATLLVSATGVDTGEVVPAAGTYARYRVEISVAGVMTCFLDKAEIASIAASALITEECMPVAYVESQTATLKSMTVKHFAAWGTRP